MFLEVSFTAVCGPPCEGRREKAGPATISDGPGIAGVVAPSQLEELGVGWWWGAEGGGIRGALQAPADRALTPRAKQPAHPHPLRSPPPPSASSTLTPTPTPTSTAHLTASSSPGPDTSHGRSKTEHRVASLQRGRVLSHPRISEFRRGFTVTNEIERLS